MPVPLAGAHRDAPLQEILNQLGHLFPGNVLVCNNDPLLTIFSGIRALSVDRSKITARQGFDRQDLWSIKPYGASSFVNAVPGATFRSDSALGAAKIRQKLRLGDRTALQKSEPDAPVALPVQSFEPLSVTEAYSG
jgi:hypothetical protein